MATIGTFTKSADGSYAGAIKTLSASAATVAAPPTTAPRRPRRAFCRSSATSRPTVASCSRRRPRRPIQMPLRGCPAIRAGREMVHRSYVGLGPLGAAVRAFEGLTPYVREMIEMQRGCPPFGAGHDAMGVALDGLQTAAYHFTRRRDFYGAMTAAFAALTPSVDRLRALQKRLAGSSVAQGAFPWRCSRSESPTRSPPGWRMAPARLAPLGPAAAA